MSMAQAAPYIMQGVSAGGSASVGALDAVMGNVAGMMNFWKNYRAAHRKRLATRNVPSRYMSLAAGDYSSFWQPLDPSQSEVDRAILSDLIPGAGFFENLAMDVLAPTANDPVRKGGL